ncbi:hypothetical protein [Pararhodobacter oceanensis]|uniref:VCBS repeat-containing protein n=1 Tax=Pararhodobacter oceanensis TaxID=2172121 RepID=A0A2T8HT97_9RHOB|nr:hypothetical protein [Pararhodobacter oceanensis]PVH28637.1 hypothetical protein DDE20_10590 [Pararhodobacter oceanensis]
MQAPSTRYHLALLALTALVTPALADSDAPQPGTLIAALSGDWNGDGDPDAVLLVQSETPDSADLRVYLGTFRGLEPQFTTFSATYAGPWGGQTPGLVALTPTTFAITSEQTGIGRTPWTQRITIAYREDSFRVAGFTHQFYDRIDPAYHGSCDVNLLTGDYVLERNSGDPAQVRNDSGRLAPGGFALQDLTLDYIPQICRALFD